MPKRIIPPGSAPASWISTSWPSRARWYAAESPLGPAPMTSTRLPLRSSGGVNCQPCSVARSPRKRSTAWIETALSSSARLQTLSHGW